MAHALHPEHAHAAQDHDTHQHADHDMKTPRGHEGHQSHHAGMIADFRRRLRVSLALTLPILVLSPMIQAFLGLEQTLAFPGDSYLLFALSTGVFFYGGWPFLKGLVDELGKHEPGMMTLIALAITVAWAYSSAVVFGLQGKVFFWELATLIDVMLLGHWIEMRSVMGASGALEALVRLLPTVAHRLSDGGTEEVPVSELRVGDRVLVKPGEKVPTDGLIVEGESSLNEAMLTGESTPVRKHKGAEAIGGSVNGENTLTLEIKKTGDETYLSQVIEMVRKAQGSRSRTQDLANRAAANCSTVVSSASPKDRIRLTPKRPSVRVPVLSNTTASSSLARSNAARLRISRPLSAPILVLTATTSGTARPSACGQVITITVTMRSREKSKSAPRLSQMIRVRRPTLIAI